MKRKRFYNNKKRNKKWTEKEQGRKIYFADKYVNSESSTDKFDKVRHKEKKPVFNKERCLSIAKGLVIAVCCFVIISVGYTVMDIY